MRPRTPGSGVFCFKGLIMTRTAPHLTTLILIAGTSTFTLNMFLPSLVAIGDDLGVSYGVVSIAISGYLAVTAGLQLVLGPLSDRYGRRPVLLGALSVFAVASLGAAWATDITTFLFFRMFQGGMTAGYAISIAVVRDTHAPKAAASRIGYIGMSMALAPMLGPVVGGLLDATFGWRANFWLCALLAAALFVLCWHDMGETRQRREQAQRANPIALLRLPTFWACALCTAFSTGGFYVFITGAPIVAIETFGLSTAVLGAIIGSITVGFMAGSFLSGRFAGRVPLTTMMLVGRIAACAGLVVGLALVVSGHLSPTPFFLSTMSVGFGNGLTMPSSNAGAMSANPDLAGSASGFVAALTLGLGAAITTLTGWAVAGPDAPVVLLLLMLAASALGLAAAIWAYVLPHEGRSST